MNDTHAVTLAAVADGVVTRAQDAQTDEEEA